MSGELVAASPSFARAADLARSGEFTEAQEVLRELGGRDSADPAVLDLLARIHQHRAGTFHGFTEQHGVKRLVWFEMHEVMESAILREKRIKRWLRPWKYDLIAAENPLWRDLAEDWGFAPLLRGQVGPGSRPG